MLGAVVALSTVSWAPLSSAAPVEVTTYPGLVSTVGSNDVYNTGERFSRCAYVCYVQSNSGREAVSRTR